MVTSTGCTIQSNVIGVSINQVPFPNAGSGIDLTSASDGAVIGGAQETGNQIADNGQAGIFITGTVHANITFNTIWNNTHNGVAVSDNTSFQDEISMNSIYQNGWLGISLGGTNTPTPNDGNNNNPNKPNRGFNYPEFSAATFPLVGGDRQLRGRGRGGHFLRRQQRSGPPDHHRSGGPRHHPDEHVFDRRGRNHNCDHSSSFPTRLMEKSQSKDVKNG